MDDHLTKIAVPFLVASAVTLGVVPLVIQLAFKLGLMDKPDPRKVHAQPIPRVGGLGILAGLLSGAAAALLIALANGVEFDFSLQKSLLALLVACVFIAIVGFIDDVRSVSSRFKLIALLFCGALICGGGLTFGELRWAGEETLEFNWLSWAATMLWIAGITVAVNFIDGLDGLAAGLVAMAGAVLSLFLFSSQEYLLGGLTISLVGALVGFLVFNRHPAKIFMGDCGSMLIGVCIAALMLMANPAVGTMRAIVLPSLALSVPLVDCSLTFFRRHYLQRRSIFSAERGHIHHRLLDRGLRHPHAVWVLYGVAAAAVLIGFVSLVFEGLATFAGLSLLVPLLWGTFRFAGSVRTNEMVEALRAKRQMNRHAKQTRALFESLQLEFANIDSFGGWWQGICSAAERLDFARLRLTVETSRDSRPMTWFHPNEAISMMDAIHAKIPISDSSYNGGAAIAEVDIAITSTVELASERLAVFSRLTTEHSLKHVRQRERRARVSSKNLAGNAIAANTTDAEQMASDLDLPPGRFGHLRVAVVHDFFYTYCGAERVVEQLIHVFPHCDLFALFDFLPDSERGFLRDKEVTTSLIQRLPLASRKHRAYLPIMPFAIEQLDVSGYDLVVSSSYLAAKGVITGPDQLHVCYCHSPVRYAWDLHHQYLRESKLGFGPRGMLARWVLHYLRSWDVRTSLSVDQFVANSEFVARRIKKLYRRQATVVNPPVDTELFDVNTEERDDFYLVAGRMVPYKRTDLIVSAFKHMPDRRLVVIGEGPEMRKVESLAGDNVTLLGFQDNETLRDYLRRAKALVFAAEEDFGIVPVEALSCGTPVVAYGKGGVTESVCDGSHGVLFDQQTEESLIDAIEKFEAKSDFGAFDPAELHSRGLRFSCQQFRTKIEKHIGRWVDARWPQAGQSEASPHFSRADRDGEISPNSDDAQQPLPDAKHS